MSEPTLTEIADRINVHLKRFEADRERNLYKWTDRKGVMHTASHFYFAWARRAGPRVQVVYVSYQGGTNLTRAAALKYLAWLDAGNYGTHYEAERSAP